jgi:hypothetical protein
MVSILKILILSSIITTKSFCIKYSNKNIKNRYYTKISDISYKRPIYIVKSKPYSLLIIKKIYNSFNDYIDGVYAMASLPLSFTFTNRLNKDYNNITII